MDLNVVETKYTDSSIKIEQCSETNPPELQLLSDDILMYLFNFLTFHEIMKLRILGKSAHKIVDRLRFNSNFLYLVRDKAMYHMRNGHLPDYVLTTDGFVMDGLIYYFDLIYQCKHFRPS